jgi:FkbM family methyltransferase
MVETMPPLITFDRVTNQLRSSGGASRLQPRAMQLSHRLLAPLGYLGISRLHAAINKALRPLSDTMIVERELRFVFPTNDYYWNRLLDSSWSYEPEIDAYLSKVASTQWIFVDLGANYGYWSARVGSGMYGPHRSIAVEAAAATFPFLQRNTRDLPQPVALYHRAIDAVSGKKVVLYGDRHAGLSIDRSWYGASSKEANEVETISIDELLDAERVDPAAVPVLVKLDVEGVEMRALQGAERTLAGQSAFLIEDAEKGAVSDAVRWLFERPDMKLFLFKDGEFVVLRGLDEILSIKARESKWQGVGLNLVATASPIWKDAISKTQRLASAE